MNENRPVMVPTAPFALLPTCPEHKVSRREVLKMSLAMGALGFVSPRAAAEKNSGGLDFNGPMPTPDQILGPFYPVQKPADGGADLTRLKGRAAQAQGQVIYVSGKVLNLRGVPCPGVNLEIWQANGAGRYTHPHDRNPAPLVIMNRVVPALADRCLNLDNRQGGYLATRLLIGKGHRNIAYISGPLGWLDASQRLAGHKRALAEAGIKFVEQLMVEGDYHDTGGAMALTQLLDTGLPFTGVVCANDEMAAGALAVARERGIAVPADLSIVGFDNAPLSRHVFPKLATVDYPIGDMGRMAARWVLRNVYGDESITVQQTFEPGLIERESVSAPGGPKPRARAKTRVHRKAPRRNESRRNESRRRP